MNKFTLLAFAIIFSIWFSSCETSKTPVEHLSSLVEQVEDKYDEFTEDDWDDIVS